MDTIILDMEKIGTSNILKFDYFGRTRHVIVKPKMMEYLRGKFDNLIEFHVGMKIRVIKTIKNNKEFYMITKVY